MSVENLSPHAAAELAAREPALLIDVREEREWVTGRIDGSRLVPLDQFRADPEAVLARDVPIIFICARGVRSMTAAKLAERLGYDRLYNLEGGTLAWARDGLPLVTSIAAGAVRAA
jgi:rhodanese-related sulfurtransferase